MARCIHFVSIHSYRHTETDPLSCLLRDQGHIEIFLKRKKNFRTEWWWSKKSICEIAIEKQTLQTQQQELGVQKNWVNYENV